MAGEQLVVIYIFIKKAVTLDFEEKTINQLHAPVSRQEIT